MRAKEFTINIPITISINGDEDPVVNTPGQELTAYGSVIRLKTGNYGTGIADPSFVKKEPIQFWN